MDRRYWCRGRRVALGGLDRVLYRSQRGHLLVFVLVVLLLALFSVFFYVAFTILLHALVLIELITRTGVIDVVLSPAHLFFIPALPILGAR
jgi:hypothetical protein